MVWQGINVLMMLWCNGAFVEIGSLPVLPSAFDNDDHGRVILNSDQFEIPNGLFKQRGVKKARTMVVIQRGHQIKSKRGLRGREIQNTF